MKANDLIAMALEESSRHVSEAMKGLSPAELAWRPRPHSNCIAFLMWHISRVEDFWINEVLLGEKHLYESEGWYKKFQTPAQDTGYGYDVAKLDAWPVPSLSLLKEYTATVRAKTLAYLKSATAAKLDEPRDFGFMKGTTGSALSHMVNELAEHGGQISYVKGIMKGIAPQLPPPPKK